MYTPTELMRHTEGLKPLDSCANDPYKHSSDVLTKQYSLQNVKVF